MDLLCKRFAYLAVADRKPSSPCELHPSPSSLLADRRMGKGEEGKWKDGRLRLFSWLPSV